MRWPRHWVRCSLIGLSGLLPASTAPAQVITVTHSFGGGPNDGKNPVGSLVQLGSTFFGTTVEGGIDGEGTIFQMGIDGNGSRLIHSFTSDPGNGTLPVGSPIQFGSNLYGMTEFGGGIYSIGTNGSGFRVTHQFAGPPGDGINPLGSLVQSGSTLYGMTSSGGSVQGSNGQYQYGTIFKVQADGTGYAVLHSFAGSPGDGSSPGYSSLAISGSTLYGVTTGGGSNGLGTIFKMGTDGSGFSVLHSFTGSPSDGDGPFGSLILSGSTLYGMTFAGGDIGAGTIFKMQLDGTGFTLMHSFAAGPSDGVNPRGGLILSGSELYGMTPSGGSSDLGILFGIGIDGTGYSVFHSFTGGPADGANPSGDLIQFGATFYGTTGLGGSANLGTVFSFTPVPEPSSLVLLAAGSLTLFARRRWGNSLATSATQQGL